MSVITLTITIVTTVIRHSVKTETYTLLMEVPRALVEIIILVAVQLLSPVDIAQAYTIVCNDVPDVADTIPSRSQRII